MAQIEAFIDNIERRGPGQMMGLSVGGIGGGGIVGNIADKLTGGDYSATKDQFARLELYLKISIAASLFAGGAALVMLLWPKGR